MKIWQDYRNGGFQKLAELAYKKEWWAVKNLCRRRVISEVEARCEHRGKTTMEWAIFHGEAALAKELCYYLLKPSQDIEGSHRVPSAGDTLALAVNDGSPAWSYNEKQASAGDKLDGMADVTIKNGRQAREKQTEMTGQKECCLGGLHQQINC
jgi:hypothetical protein